MRLTRRSLHSRMSRSPDVRSGWECSPPIFPEALRYDMKRTAFEIPTILRFWAGLTLLAIGCGAPKPQQPTSEPPKEDPSPLQLAAASDLQKALSAVAKKFTSDTLTEVNITYG